MAMGGSYKVGYAEVLEQVNTCVGVDDVVCDLVQSDAVQHAKAGLEAKLGLDPGQSWGYRLVPECSGNAKVYRWCSFENAAIIFQPAPNSQPLYEQARLYRELDVQVKVQLALDRIASAKVKVRPAAAEKQEEPGAAEKQVGFLVAYSELEKVVSGEIPAGLYMMNVNHVPGHAKAREEVEETLGLEPGYPLPFHILPRLPIYPGGPSAAQWVKVKGATYLYCESDCYADLDEVCLYKQAMLYREYLRQEQVRGATQQAQAQPVRYLLGSSMQEGKACTEGAEGADEQSVCTEETGIPEEQVEDSSNAQTDFVTVLVEQSKKIIEAQGKELHKARARIQLLESLLVDALR